MQRCFCATVAGNSQTLFGHCIALEEVDPLTKTVGCACPLDAFKLSHAVQTHLGALLATVRVICAINALLECQRALFVIQFLCFGVQAAVYTQELATEVKAEMRAVLQHYGITQFKIRPVRRNYAFEQAGVAHAMQWVLKVTYPAGMPQLPLGLSGDPQHLH